MESQVIYPREVFKVNFTVSKRNRIEGNDKGRDTDMGGGGRHGTRGMDLNKFVSVPQAAIQSRVHRPMEEGGGLPQPQKDGIFA